MTRFYSLFVTDERLLRGPLVQNLNHFHNLIVNLHKEEKVNFLLQTPLSARQRNKLEVIYDRMALDLKKIEVTPFHQQTLITVTMIPKELGGLRIGFSYPEIKLEYSQRLLQSRINAAKQLHAA